MSETPLNTARRRVPNFTMTSQAQFSEAQIKLSVVASDIFGVSGRAMMAALVAGERDPKVLADMARGSMRGKPPGWRRRSPGGSPTITRSCCAPMPARIDGINTDIDVVQGRIDEQITPFAKAVTPPG